MLMQDTYWRNDNRRVKTSLKNMYLSLYCKGSKRVTQGLRVRESWRPNKDCNILTPTLVAVSVVSFSFSRVAQPEAQRPDSLLGDGFLYCILSATSLDPNSSGAPRAPSAWRGFPYYISSLTPTVWLLVLTELYNSSTPTQSPTQSLEWHVWSSSSGNNCHAVHRSLSSGASLCSGTVGPSACPILSANLTCAISFD